MLSSNIFKKNQNSQDIFLHINLVLKNLSKIMKSHISLKLDLLMILNCIYQSNCNWHGTMYTICIHMVQVLQYLLHFQALNIDILSILKYILKEKFLDLSVISFFFPVSLPIFLYKTYHSGLMCNFAWQTGSVFC